MRITPPFEEGLHPAFPLDPRPGISNTLLPQTLLAANGLGLLRLGFAFLLRRPNPLASASRTVAYSMAILAPCATFSNWERRETIRNFLASENIVLPKPKLFDRFGFFDQDDRLLLGGCLGVFAAGCMRKPWAVTGWHRHLAAFALGSTVFDTGFALYPFWRMTPEQREKHRLAVKESMKQHADWAKLLEPYSPMHGKAISISGVGEIGVGSHPSSSTMPGPLAALSNSSLQDREVRDGPHVARQKADEPEPFPMPVTNYTWEQSIQDLEQHVGRLTERRQLLAREAEFLWAWLSEKEAQYYSQPESKGEPTTPEGKERLLYISLLGNAHYQTWREVNSYDWMIADSNKRLEQLRSRLANDDDKVTWRAGCSEAARDVKPEFAIQHMRTFVEQTAPTALDQLRMSKAAMRQDVKAYNEARTSTEKILNPIQNKVTTKKELLADMEKRLEENQKNLELAVEVTGQLKAELERERK